MSDREMDEDAGEDERRGTPPPGYTRGPHPPSPAADTVLHLLAELSTTGYLAATPTGLLYLDLEDTWVTSVQEEMARWVERGLGRSSVHGHGLWTIVHSMNNCP